MRNAFCAVRPPGHHAGPCGLISGPDAGAGAESHGFCLLNNVSIGAAYAMNVYRETIKKVAIVDFDVHHGNGTEETIRWLNPGLTTVDVLSANIFGQLHTPRYKPWFDVDDAKNVLFVSVHGYGPRERGYERFMPAAAFYPGTGKTCVPQGKEEESFDGSNTLPPALSNAVSTQSSLSTSSERGEEHQILEEIRNNEDGDDNDDDEDDSSFSDQDQVDEDSPDEDVELQAEILKSMQSSPYSRLLNTHNFQKPTSNSYAPPLVLDIGVNLADEEMVQGEYRHQWRNYFRDIIFPKLMDFKPDCIFISAGFDAHKKDLINSGYISLVEEDYEWVTANLMKIANATCNGRIISALEGGYQLGGEHCSAFAKSVKCHVATLCSPGLRASEVKYDPVEAEREKSEERLVSCSMRCLKSLFVGN